MVKIKGKPGAKATAGAYNLAKPEKLKMSVAQVAWERDVHKIPGVSNLCSN